ncbi:MAG: hypothetical protein LBF56_00910 [Holosporales bacterium]|jgi:hypothetical protein|nr:hypothetical protein [Holosporales bacterium]
MKRLGVMICVLCNCITYGAETFSQEKFESYVHEWSRYLAAPIGKVSRPDRLPFSMQLFKDKLLNEIGGDHLAVTAFNLLHQHEFTAFVDHCVDNLSKMSGDNGGRFRDLLITSAPVINLIKGSGPHIQKIIDIAGGARNILDHVPTFPQFCYEMLFCVMVDTSHHGPEELYNYELSRACEYVCSEVPLTWSLAEEEGGLLGIVGIREDNDGYGCVSHFEYEWCK